MPVLIDILQILSVYVCHVLTHRLLIPSIVGVATRDGASGYVLKFQPVATHVPTHVARARFSRRNYVAVSSSQHSYDDSQSYVICD